MIRALVVVVAVVVVELAGASACVTTQQVPDASPDPRDDLPPLAGADKPAAKPAPVRTVLDLSPRDPIVNVRVVFETGSADDPAGKDGLALLTAHLMKQATEKLSASDLADALFPWAAELDVQVDKDALAFLGRVHKDHADEYARILTDILVHPRLDKADFARVKAEQKAYLENTLRTGDDEALQREALEATLYPAGHAYHHTPAGTVKGVDAITLDDVRGFLKNELTRDRAIIGVSGGAPPSFVDALKGAVESLPSSAGARADAKMPPAPAKNTALLVDKPAAGSAISLGYPVDLARGDGDYPAMKLAETWFGEHRNLIGHLFNSMREKRGLNYGD